MILWRIASTTRHWAADDLTGMGAATDPGRWNDVGQRVIYAAPTLAMAVLETVAHADDAGLPLNRHIVRIDVPLRLWKARRVFKPQDLDPGWDAIPCGIVSVTHGTKWYQEGKQVLLEVPSVIVPEESVIVIHAEHRDARRITASTVRRYDYNLLFRGR